MNEDYTIKDILNDIWSYNLMFNSRVELGEFFEKDSLKTDSYVKTFTKTKNDDVFTSHYVQLDYMLSSYTFDKEINLSILHEMYMTSLEIFNSELEKRKNHKDYDTLLEAILCKYYAKHKDTTDNIRLKKLDRLFNKIEDLQVDPIVLVLMGKGWIQTSPQKCVDTIKLEQNFNDMFEFLDKHTQKELGEHLPIIDIYRMRAKSIDYRRQFMLLYAAADIMAVYDFYLNDPTALDAADRYVTPWELLSHLWCKKGSNHEIDCYQFLYEGANEVSLYHLTRENIEKDWKYVKALYLFQKTSYGYYVLTISDEVVAMRYMGKMGNYDRNAYDVEITDPGESEVPRTLTFTELDRSNSIELMELPNEAYSEKYLTTMCHPKNKPVFKEISYLYAITRTALYIPTRDKGMFYRVPKALHKSFGSFSFENPCQLIHIIEGTNINPGKEKYYLTFLDSICAYDVTDFDRENGIDVEVKDIEYLDFDKDGVSIRLKNKEHYYFFRDTSDEAKKYIHSLTRDLAYRVDFHNGLAYYSKKSSDMDIRRSVDRIRIDEQGISFLEDGYYRNKDNEKLKIFKKNIILESPISIDRFIKLDLKEMKLIATITICKGVQE